MARTTAEAVKLVIETDDGISTDLVPFIETASALVDSHCVAPVDGNGNPINNATRLELIERWLTAHFYSIRDNATRTKTEKAGSVGASYSEKNDLNLNLTHWGQQAMMLDTSQGLADWNKDMQADRGKTSRARVGWGGKKQT